MGLLELFNSYDKKKRRSHFKNLFAVARADGVVCREEMDLVIGLAKKFQMTPQEATQILRNPDEGGLVLPKTPRERMEHLYDLVTVMLADGRIDEREVFLCQSLAEKMGCREGTSAPLIRDMMACAQRGVAPEKAIDSFLEKYT